MKFLFTALLITFFSCSSPKLTEERVRELKEEIYNYELSAHDTLLDVGCGNGMVDGFINSIYPQMFFVLEDIHKPYRNLICSNFQKISPESSFSEIKKRIKTLSGKEDTIPLADRSFNKILCRLSLHEFKNRPKMVSELTRLLTDNGSLIIVEVLSTYKGEREMSCRNLLLNGSEIKGMFGDSGLSLKCYQDIASSDSSKATVFIFGK